MLLFEFGVAIFFISSDFFTQVTVVSAKKTLPTYLKQMLHHQLGKNSRLLLVPIRQLFGQYEGGRWIK
jgi:hypothetical protein